MVEINNQRKAFLDMLAWSEGTDNGRQKTRNHGYDVIVGGELFTDYSDHSSQTCHAKPKTKSTGWTLPASFRWWMSASSLAWKTSLRKVRTLWHCRLRSVALYLWLIVVYLSGNRLLRSNIWASLAGRWLCHLSIRLTAWLQNLKKRRNGQRDWCMVKSHSRLSPLWLSASSSACHAIS